MASTAEMIRPAMVGDEDTMTRRRILARIEFLCERQGGAIAVRSVSELRSELCLRGDVNASKFSSGIYHLATGDLEADNRARISMIRRDPTSADSPSALRLPDTGDHRMDDKGPLIITVL